jgi:hypothetical protein
MHWPLEGFQRLWQYTSDVDNQRVVIIVPRERQRRIPVLGIAAVKSGPQEFEHLSDLVGPVTRVDARVLHHPSLDDRSSFQALNPKVGEVGEMDGVGVGCEGCRDQKGGDSGGSGRQ